MVSPLLQTGPAIVAGDWDQEIMQTPFLQSIFLKAMNVLLYVNVDAFLCSTKSHWQHREHVLVESVDSHRH